MLLTAHAAAASGRMPADGIAASSAALPDDAKLAISGTLGASLPGYGVTQAGGHWRMHNAALRLGASLTARGMVVSRAASPIGLGLSALGRGAALTPVTAGTPVASRNRLDLNHAQIDEWYVNGPAGLEQGFDLATRPAGIAGAPLTLALALAPGWSALVDATRTGATLSAPAAGSLRYDGLVARDAAGTQLAAWMEVSGGRLLLHVDDSRARYPVRIDPLLQDATLLASDRHVSNGFGGRLGAAVAIGANIIVAGAPHETVGGNLDQGEAYVFVRPPGGWSSGTEQARLFASDGATQLYPFFGSGVAVSGDSIVVVGGNKAYVFTKPAGGWKGDLTETAQLTLGQKNWFVGYNVAMQADTIALSAFSSNYHPKGSEGEIAVFQKPASGWQNATPQAFLSDSRDDELGGIGQGLAISGETIVAGAPGAGLGGLENTGEVAVFSRPANGWQSVVTPTARLRAADLAAGAYLGYAVAIDGDTIVAGAPYAPGPRVRGNPSAPPGAAYVFVKPAGGWVSGTETAKLSAVGMSDDPDEGGSPVLGQGVAVSGNQITAGAPGDDARNIIYSGAVFLYKKPKTGWRSTNQPFDIAEQNGPPPLTQMGLALAMDGSVVVAGALNAEPVEYGSVHVFQLP
jgi:hypothetical protein